MSDDQPGIRRHRSGTGFSYVDRDGRPVRDRNTLARIRSLAVPPAWTSVWICPLPQGHLQATGRDARGRKQYRYHPRWREVRDESKYGKLSLFGRTLPGLRARLRDDLARPGLSRDKVLATVVRLLETTLIRIGNEEYARANNSFGLTTLKGHHVRIEGADIRFRFRGKSGKSHDVLVNDRRLARLVKRCRELPGQDLFQYLDDAGEPQPITSADVNDYLRQACGPEFTTKDFRTWAGTLFAARYLPGPHRDGANAPSCPAASEVVKLVARQLGNTAAVCRKCYIHPSVLEALQDPTLRQQWLSAVTGGRSEPELSEDEVALLRFLDAVPSGADRD